MIYLKIVKKGDKVKVDYIGTLQDGTVFDSSEKHDAPLEFTVGSGQLIEGFDSAVEGMSVGEEKSIDIPPKKAYGDYNPELVKEMPREFFKIDQEIKPGMVFMVTLQDNRQIPVRVTEVNGDKITIDLNPPLAGKTLRFKIKLLDIAQ